VLADPIFRVGRPTEVIPQASFDSMGVVDDVELCVRLEYERLVRVVAVATGSVPAAQDAVQEAFARALERAARGGEFTHLAGWIVTVALNVARSGRRRARVEARAGHRSSPPDDRVDVEMLVDLDRAVRALPQRQRETVVLYYLLDLDVSTVAELLGVSPGTVKTALARARDKLAVALTDREGDPT
jgi:RNA polymerase sigma-70 factor, ECF subfamily